jgi:hypothetical protein
MIPIDSYNIYWDRGYLLQFEKLATVNSYDHYFFEAKSLVPGILYSFQVSAVNQVGEGPLSEVVSNYAQSAPGKPQAPRRVAQQMTSASTADMTLEWSP